MRIGRNRRIGSKRRIWRNRRTGRIGDKGSGVEARGYVATRGPQLSLLTTTVPRAKPFASVADVKTVQRRPFEFLPMSLKNVRGVFPTSSDVITFLGINTDKLYTSERK